jgi:hypothetical protein
MRKYFTVVLIFICLDNFFCQSKDEINKAIKQMNWDSKPTQIIITFPDSVDAYSVIGKKIAKAGIPIKESNKEFGSISTDFWAGKDQWSKYITQRIIVSTEKNIAVITGEYTSKVEITTMNISSEETGKAQAKGLGTSVYRGSFYNILHIFWEYKPIITFK